MVQGSPNGLLSKLEGRVWRKQVEAEELEALGDDAVVLSTHLNAGRTVARVESPVCPGPGFLPAEPNLEDVYFSTLKN